MQSESRHTGLQLGVGITEANSGDFFVRLKPSPRRGIQLVMDDVRARIDHNIPGLTIETSQLIEDLIGDLTSVPQPIEIKLYSDSEKTLRENADKVAKAIRKVNGDGEVKNVSILEGDAANIKC